VRRHAELKSVFPARDLEQGWAYQYQWNDQQNIAELERIRDNAVLVV
jgi:hypothetical protein